MSRAPAAGSGPSGPAPTCHAWAAATRRANIRVASHLVMRRAPLKAVQELLGHSTIEMTMRYSHLSPDVRKDAVRLLDADPSENRLTTASFSTVSS